jgi:hypothetical protein
MEKLLEKLNSVEISMANVEDEIIDARNDISDMYEEIYEMKKNGIINVNLFKLKMQQEGLWSKEIEDFIDNYLKFYNN